MGRKQYSAYSYQWLYDTGTVSMVMDETTEIQGGTGSQHLFGLTPKLMFFLVNHTQGKTIKSPTDWEVLENLIKVKRVELNLEEQDVTGHKRIFQVM